MNQMLARVLASCGVAAHAPVTVYPLALTMRAGTRGALPLRSMMNLSEQGVVDSIGIKSSAPRWLARASDMLDFPLVRIFQMLATLQMATI